MKQRTVFVMVSRNNDVVDYENCTNAQKRALGIIGKIRRKMFYAMTIEELDGMYQRAKTLWDNNFNEFLDEESWWIKKDYNTICREIKERPYYKYGLAPQKLNVG